MVPVPYHWGLVLLAGALLWGALGGVPAAHAQPDSVRAAILKEKGFPPDHSPTGALWRSAAVPGWGQYYNRQYYKIPFVYAGFAAFAYRIYTSHQEYLLFKRAHLFGRGPQLAGEGEPNPYRQFESQFNEVVGRIGGERLATMRALRDQYRRRRNLAILGTGLFYALTILDAYVSAHLLTFDVGEGLSMRVRPVGHLRSARPPPRGGPPPLPESLVLERGGGLHLQLRF
jgi:hypothetical protein